MVGLRTLKETLSTTFCQVRFKERRRRMGLPVGEETASHVIFTGNPGTGKTTVARLLGRIYRALGLLSKGEVISTERRELVGEYIGQTEEKMNAILRRARGNVLFIDEAYSLCTDSDDRRDYGRHVVESLLSVLTEPHPDMVVVLAGYDDEMDRLMQSNPGLKSRFPYKFHFADYTADELMQIAGLTLERGGYRLTPEAGELLRDTVENALAHKDRFFANARWVNRFVTSGILPAMARRVMAMDVDRGACRRGRSYPVAGYGIGIRCKKQAPHRLQGIKKPARRRKAGHNWANHKEKSIFAKTNRSITSISYNRYEYNLTTGSTERVEAFL